VVGVGPGGAEEPGLGAAEKLRGNSEVGGVELVKLLTEVGSAEQAERSAQVRDSRDRVSVVRRVLIGGNPSRTAVYDQNVSLARGQQEDVLPFKNALSVGNPITTLYP
jgi:hypothetical protein